MFLIPHQLTGRVSRITLPVGAHPLEGLGVPEFGTPMRAGANQHVGGNALVQLLVRVFGGEFGQQGVNEGICCLAV